MTIPPAVRHALEERLERHRREHSRCELEAVDVRYRGDLAYVTAACDGGQSERLLRLRWKGSQDEWGVAVWSESEQSYVDLTLPTGMPPERPRMLFVGRTKRERVGRDTLAGPQHDGRRCLHLPGRGPCVATLHPRCTRSSAVRGPLRPRNGARQRRHRPGAITDLHGSGTTAHHASRRWRGGRPRTPAPPGARRSDAHHRDGCRGRRESRDRRDGSR